MSFLAKGPSYNPLGRFEFPKIGAPKDLNILESFYGDPANKNSGFGNPHIPLNPPGLVARAAAL